MLRFRGTSLASAVILLVGLFLWPISAGAQTFSEYSLPSAGSSPLGITTGPDGALWFGENSGNKIGRITTGGVVTEFTIPTTDSGPQSITTGPDGALWFTEGAGNKIGRIPTTATPADPQITEYSIPSTGSSPLGITTGPDGALWFTEITPPIGPNAPSPISYIGRITTGGVVTEFTIPTAPSAPVSITTGPDGALWFTESAADGIGRITTAGVITEFPRSAAGPYSITVGPDGALWFTETMFGPALGSITIAGVTTQFSLPTGEPLGITNGPDGALWFTVGSANQIGRITTAGIVTQFLLPTAAGFPFGIANGSDGALWFTERDGNKIGRFAPPISGTAPVITTNPSNQVVNTGQTATFSAAASGTPTPTVKWQQSTDGGVTFTNIAGATSTTYSFTTTASQNGYQYQAVFTNSAGTATTTAATLTVNSAPMVTMNPTNQTVNLGRPATLNAAASGTPTPTVQWQQSTSAGNPFTIAVSSPKCNSAA